ncbi:uncharacterized protein LOC109706837 [Ananas comosus]|uniref:Uncharacterized protein LOC109706837 n=1 Tax=Ananas comosus TaxID=4615 RepID=A0A6P5EIV5_ANACO|nr:uncharacterized protein LOC109706837 [Ananas comosus]
MKLNAEDYASSYFTVERYRDAYSLNIKPLPAQEEWKKSDIGFSVLPPILARPAGRPRKKRIRGAGEMIKRKHKCARCGGFGHHARTCKNTVPVEGSSIQSKSKIRRKTSGSQQQEHDSEHAAAAISQQQKGLFYDATSFHQAIIFSFIFLILLFYIISDFKL